jgi:hypothetical protein
MCLLAPAISIAGLCLYGRDFNRRQAFNRQACLKQLFEVYALGAFLL